MHSWSSSSTLLLVLALAGVRATDGLESIPSDPVEARRCASLFGRSVCEASGCVWSSGGCIPAACEQILDADNCDLRGGCAWSGQDCVALSAAISISSSHSTTKSKLRVSNNDNNSGSKLPGDCVNAGLMMDCGAWRTREECLGDVECIWESGVCRGTAGKVMQMATVFSFEFLDACLEYGNSLLEQCLAMVSMPPFEDSARVSFNISAWWFADRVQVVVLDRKRAEDDVTLLVQVRYAHDVLNRRFGYQLQVSPQLFVREVFSFERIGTNITGIRCSFTTPNFGNDRLSGLIDVLVHEPWMIVPNMFTLNYSTTSNATFEFETQIGYASAQDSVQTTDKMLFLVPNITTLPYLVSFPVFSRRVLESNSSSFISLCEEDPTNITDFLVPPLAPRRLLSLNISLGEQNHQMGLINDQNDEFVKCTQFVEVEDKQNCVAKWVKSESPESSRLLQEQFVNIDGGPCEGSELCIASWNITDFKMPLQNAAQEIIPNFIEQIESQTGGACSGKSAALPSAQEAIQANSGLALALQTFEDKFLGPLYTNIGFAFNLDNFVLTASNISKSFNEDVTGQISTLLLVAKLPNPDLANSFVSLALTLQKLQSLIFLPFLNVSTITNQMAIYILPLLDDLEMANKAFAAAQVVCSVFIGKILSSIQCKSNLTDLFLALGSGSLVEKWTELQNTVTTSMMQTVNEFTDLLKPIANINLATARSMLNGLIQLKAAWDKSIGNFFLVLEKVLDYVVDFTVDSLCFDTEEICTEMPISPLEVVFCEISFCNNSANYPCGVKTFLQCTNVQVPQYCQVQVSYTVRDIAQVINNSNGTIINALTPLMSSITPPALLFPQFPSLDSVLPFSLLTGSGEAIQNISTLVSNFLLKDLPEDIYCVQNKVGNTNATLLPPSSFFSCNAWNPLLLLLKGAAPATAEPTSRILAFSPTDHPKTPTPHTTKPSTHPFFAMSPTLPLSPSSIFAFSPTTESPFTKAPSTLTIPSSLSPTTISPSTSAPTSSPTSSPETVKSTNLPSTSPITPAPKSPAPAIPVPPTPAPTIPAPSTSAPPTAAPATLAPATPKPTTPAPITPAPTTPAPTTSAPTTLAPTIPAPSAIIPKTKRPVTHKPSVQTQGPTSLPPTPLPQPSSLPSTTSPKNSPTISPVSPLTHMPTWAPTSNPILPTLKPSQSTLPTSQSTIFPSTQNPTSLQPTTSIPTTSNSLTTSQPVILSPSTQGPTSNSTASPISEPTSLRPTTTTGPSLNSTSNSTSLPTSPQPTISTSSPSLVTLQPVSLPTTISPSTQGTTFRPTSNITTSPVSEPSSNLTLSPTSLQPSTSIPTSNHSLTTSQPTLSTSRPTSTSPSTQGAASNSTASPISEPTSLRPTTTGPSLNSPLNSTSLPTSFRPTTGPSLNLTSNTTSKPSFMTLQPSTQEPTTFQPTFNVTASPISEPTSPRPTMKPTSFPTSSTPTIPTNQPTSRPTAPTSQPTISPSTKIPTLRPTLNPTTLSPTRFPTLRPTTNPSWSPTSSPTTLKPTRTPTLPSSSPTRRPTLPRTDAPTVLPPTLEPTLPTPQPTLATSQPTFPTPKPTRRPTLPHTDGPTLPAPSNIPTFPTNSPSLRPTFLPSTSRPTTPTSSPTTSKPSKAPTSGPTKRPTLTPTISPTSPTNKPTLTPTTARLTPPTSISPTLSPTTPTSRPTSFPSQQPTHFSHTYSGTTNGDDHVCALDATTSLVNCWGDNTYGQLGLGNSETNIGTTPADMGGSLPYIQLGTGLLVLEVSAGDLHNCCLLSNSQVKCWGSNSNGQLGFVSSGESVGLSSGDMGDNLPTVNLGANALAQNITCGFVHSCVLLQTTQVKCWGDNNYGQLGFGGISQTGSTTMGDALPAVNLGSSGTAIQVVAGFQHTCVLLAPMMSLKCWGYNHFGQLGIGSAKKFVGNLASDMGNNLPFVSLGTDLEVIRYDAGYFSTCAIVTGSMVKCWGGNWEGQLGMYTVEEYSTPPIGSEISQMGDNLPFVDLGTNVLALDIAVGGFHACVLTTTFQIKCWGGNSEGQLGLGTAVANIPNAAYDQMGDYLPFVNIGTNELTSRISVGYDNTCALLENNKAKCWGNNLYGQLGVCTNVENVGTSPSSMGNNLQYANEC